MLTSGEQYYLQRLQGRLTELRNYLNDANLADDADMATWYRYVATIRAIQGNINNDLSFIATVMVKQYLGLRFDISNFDAHRRHKGLLA